MEKTVWREEDTKEDKEGNAKGAEAAIYIQIYGEIAKSQSRARETRQYRRRNR